MKLRIISVLILLLCLSCQTQASPFSKVKHFVKEHPGFVAAAGTLVVTSIYQYKATTYCSRGYLEVCNEGYGARRGFDIFSEVGGGLLLAASEKCKRDQPGWKFCYGLAYGVPTMQTVFGTEDYVHFRPCRYDDPACGNHDKTPDFLRRR